MDMKRLDDPSKKPAHVPQELVFAVDFYDDPDINRSPHDAILTLREGPRLFWNAYSPRFGEGSWIVTHAEDIRTILAQPETFSNRGIMNHQALTGATWPLIPDELDGQEHRVFRELISPWFTPSFVSGMTDFVRATARELIAALDGTTECDFMQAFARTLPTAIFMRVLGLPAEDTPMFMRWEFDLMHTLDGDKRTAAARAIMDYLEDAACQRRSAPRDDLISNVVRAKIAGRDISGDEIQGTLFLLFLASLDTVVNALGFHFHYLAQDQTLQQRLRDNPRLIEPAVEELLRRFTTPSLRRRAVRDTEIAGIQIKAGDWMTLMYQLGSLDPAEHQDPLTVDIDRPSKRHLSFAAGPHFCIGAQLARRELKIAMEEWLGCIPPFRLKEGDAPVFHAGTAFGVDYLPLTWAQG